MKREEMASLAAAPEGMRDVLDRFARSLMAATVEPATVEVAGQGAFRAILVRVEGMGAVTLIPGDSLDLCLHVGVTG